MSKLFMELPHKDKLEYYISHYAGYEDTRGDREPASLEYLMRVWEDTKNHCLYKLLGNEYIIKCEFEYDTPEEDLFAAMSHFLWHNTFVDNYNKFIKDYLMKVYKYDPDVDYRKVWNSPEELVRIDNFDGNDAECFLQELVCTRALVRSTYSSGSFKIYLDNNRTITVNNGAKPMRILGKIVEAFGIEGFEEFRIGISQVLNKGKIKGTACLSIHPLDYITMSDNANGWDSCMKWMDGAGCYRLGTVEMMNSESVLVGYIESKDTLYFGPHEWNSKKWRNLFIVTEKMVSTIKGYPYQSTEIEEFFLGWIRELAEKNLSWTYDDTIYAANPDGSSFEVCVPNKVIDFELTTGFMYNDFGNSNKPNMLLATDKLGTYYEHCYSGDAECMFCGETFRPDNEGCIHGGDDASTDMVHDMCDVVCIGCTTLHYCENCNCALGRYEECYEVDGCYLCEDCYEDDSLCVDDAFTEERHFRDNCTEIMVFEKPFDDTETINLNIDYLYNYGRGYQVNVYSIRYLENHYLNHPIRYYTIKTLDGSEQEVCYCLLEDITDRYIRDKLKYHAMPNPVYVYEDLMAGFEK